MMFKYLYLAAVKQNLKYVYIIFTLGMILPTSIILTKHNNNEVLLRLNCIQSTRFNKYEFNICDNIYIYNIKRNFKHIV